MTTDGTTWSPSSVGAAAEEHALVDDRRVDGRVGEEAEQERAQQAAHQVDGDDVEAVVELERPA